jgi:hypothetical protein
LAGAGIAILILMAGCNLASKVVVEPDGSGTYSVILTVPDAPSNPGHALYEAVLKGSAKSDVPLKVTPYSSGNNSGAMTTFHFLSLSDLNAESQRLAASGSGGIGVGINRDATGWHFSASSAQTLVAPPTATGAASAATGSPGGAINPSALNSLLNISVVVQLPGAPAVNNAKAVSHTRTTSSFTWSLAPGQAAKSLQASTTFVGNQASVKLSSAMTAMRSHTISDTAGHTTKGAGHGLEYGLMAAAALVLLAAAGLVLSRRSASA